MVGATGFRLIYSLMAERGVELFKTVQSAEFIRALVGKTEDVHLDCKEWADDDGAAQRVFAKAACGLTNSEGGVLLVGMRARPSAKDEPDLIESAAPVADTSAVKSRILDLVGQLVEPRVEGVQTAEVNEPPGSKSGFVVVYIPASEGPPRRSRKDWKFYQRIGSGTFPMEYFQIEERFGKRPPPKLALSLEMDGLKAFPQHTPERWFVLGLQNVGSGIAKFPSIRFRRSSALNIGRYGIDDNGGFGLPSRPSESEWIIFRGGVDDVIYPGELLKIAKLWQAGGNIDSDGLPYAEIHGPTGQRLSSWVFKANTFQCEISCEGIPTITVEKVIPEQSEPIPATKR
jgi:hypothetical protein